MSDALGRPNAVLVLGGGSEIGLAIADRLVDRGAGRVVLLGRHPAAMEEASLSLHERGAQVSAQPFDAVDVERHQEHIDAAFDEHGDFDVVVLAFGVLGDQAEYEADPAAAGRDGVTNYAGAVSAGLAAARRLDVQGHGALVVLSSIAGQRPRRDNFVYGSAKAGLDFFATGLREALRESGVQVLVVRPGFVRTKMTAGRAPAQFATDAGAVAATVLRALDRGSDVAWAPPLLRWVALAFRLLPQPIFRRLRR